MGVALLRPREVGAPVGGGVVGVQEFLFVDPPSEPDWRNPDDSLPGGFGLDCLMEGVGVGVDLSGVGFAVGGEGEGEGEGGFFSEDMGGDGRVGLSCVGEDFSVEGDHAGFAGRGTVEGFPGTGRAWPIIK